jgi:GAF domain-containing protein
MIQSLSKTLGDLLLPRRITNPGEQSHARLTVFFTGFFALLNLLLALIVAATPSPLQLETVVALMSLFALNVIAFIFAQSARWQIGAFLFTLYSVIVSLGAALIGPQASIFLIQVIPIVYVGLIFGLRGIVAIVIVFGVQLLLFGVMRSQTGPMVAIPDVFINPLTGTFVTIALLFSVAVMMAAIVLEQQRLQQYSNRLYAQLRATSEVAQTTSAILNLDQLLPRTVEYIRDRFGFYHVQIFLVDQDRHYADLVASTGEVGQALIQRGHRLVVGSRSIIGRVTATGEPIMASDTATDLLHRTNELLPETRSELALPLIAGDKLIGALDVQSTRPSAFSQEDTDSLQIMATQVAIAVRNAQLFEDQRRALTENRRLFLEAESNLREIERLNQRLIGGAWAEFMMDRMRPDISYTIRDGDLVEEESWSAGALQAFDKRRPVVITENNRHLIAVPIELRGQILGAIEVEVTEKLRQSDLLEMLQAIAGRLALNLDNARLFEEAQKFAQQELEINTITTKMQGVNQVDELLQSVLAELTRALNASGASVRLGLPETIQGTQGTVPAALNGNARPALRANGAHTPPATTGTNMP